MLRFTDSFDHFNTTTQLLTKWTSADLTTPYSIASGGGRNGTDSLRCTSPNTSSARRIIKTLDSQGTWILHFGFRASSVFNWSATAPRGICGLLDAGTLQCDLRLINDGTLRVTRNGTTLGTTTFALSDNVYYHIGLKIVISDTVGTVGVWVNGDNKLSLTSQDTKNTANATANDIFLGSANGAGNGVDIDWDDLVVCDGQGGVNNDFLGDLRVEAILPTGAGSSAQWTRGGSDSGANWSQVEENPPNDDTDYNTSSTPTETDLFAYGDVTPTSGAVKGVQVVPLARKDDAGSRDIRTKAKSGTTIGSGATVALADSYAYYPHVFETNPDTAAEWTIAEVNGAEFGYEEVA